MLMIDSNKGRPIQWTDEKTARLWDHYSRNPVVTSDLYFSKVYGRFVLRKARLDRRRPLRILDFGCGPGYMWEHVREASARWQYTGLDFSSRSVERLRERARQGSAGFQGAVHVASLPSPLPAEQYDVILLLEVVEHLTDDYLQGTLKEVVRLLRPGGQVLVTTPHDEDLAIDSQYCPECETVFHKWQHVRSWTQSSLVDVFAAHDLQAQRLWTGHWSDYVWYGWVFNRAAKVLRNRRLDPHLFAIFTRR